MHANRRNFIRKVTIGTGAIISGLPGSALATADVNDRRLLNSVKPSPGTFNMSGYAAPKMDNVRIGIIGLGSRGPYAVERMSYIEGVEIIALCDQYPDRIANVQKMLAEKGLPIPTAYGGSKQVWKELCDRPDIDLVYITTPWSWHTPMAVYAMLQGKHAATEVPAAKTIDECWQLVETSEKTKKHCMMLENCCYDFFELLTLNMVRNGFFGELVHVEGAYLHDLRGSNFNKNGDAEMWRLRENISRNGNLYPTHGLGPVAQCLNINRGDQMDYMVSMSSNDFIMGAIAKEKAATDPFYNEFKDKHYRGDMNTSVIKTVKGKTIMLQHDVSTPRPYSRTHQLNGTKGMARKYPEPACISSLSNADDWMNAAQMKELEEKYTLPIVKHVGELAKKIGGHGGMDFIMDWRLIDNLRNGLPLDQDVYDAALWSSIAPLSEQSVANQSRSMDVPDFTRGAWKTNNPVNLTLDGGGNTQIRKISEKETQK